MPQQKCGGQKDNLQEFYHGGSENRAQVVRLGGKRLCPLSHLLV